MIIVRMATNGTVGISVRFSELVDETRYALNVAADTQAHATFHALITRRIKANRTSQLSIKLFAHTKVFRT